MLDLAQIIEQSRVLHNHLMALVDCSLDEHWTSPDAAPATGKPTEVEVRGQAFYFPAEGAFRGLHGVLAWRPIQKS